MKFDILKTRRGKLEKKLRDETHIIVNEILKTPVSEISIERILTAIDDYEKDNLETIDKLRKDKLVDTKRINGALKQTIKAHGPITMLLIGSATKRIYGSLLENTIKPRVKYTDFQIGRIIFEIILVVTTLILVLT